MKKISKPFFSIIIPTLNEEEYLPKLLDNLSNQTYNNFEVIVIDASSTDNTVKEAGKFSNLNLKIKITKRKNLGFQRNTGGKIATGKWFIHIDADNELRSDFLQEIFKNLKKNPNIDFFLCRMSISTNNIMFNIFIEIVNFILLLSSYIKPIVTLGVLIGVRAEIGKKIVFNEKTPLYEDLDVISKLFKQGYFLKFFYNPFFIISVRRYKREGILKMIVVHFKDLIYYLTGKNVKKSIEYPMLGGNQYKN